MIRWFCIGFAFAGLFGWAVCVACVIYHQCDHEERISKLEWKIRALTEAHNQNAENTDHNFKQIFDVMNAVEDCVTGEVATCCGPNEGTKPLTNER